MNFNPELSVLSVGGAASAPPSSVAGRSFLHPPLHSSPATG